MNTRTFWLGLVVTLLSSAAHAQEEPVEYAPHLRFAIGAVGGGGPTINGTDGSIAFGLWGQVGVQVNRSIAVYYQGHQMVGLYAGFAAFSFNEVMVDWTIKDVLQLGIGPSLDVISSDQCFLTCGPNSKTTIVAFGADLRVGVALGWKKRFHRVGFMAGVDLHPTFYDAGTTTAVSMPVLITLGGGFY